ncbi:MAG: hypothetical protein KAI70_06110 [Candidatus Omnitrophica bacterium]|nr:hypothetical protein [Candidatus Omnitrophota bacterium]
MKAVRVVGMLIILTLTFSVVATADVKMRVVAVNPSETEFKTTKVQIYLPEEVTPGDIVDPGELLIEYDAKKSIYYMHKKEVELGPRQTKIFEVLIRDVWIIPEVELGLLEKRTTRILLRLQDTDYYKEAVQMADIIFQRIEEIRTGQSDITISRENHIGIYRTNLKVVERIKDDIDKLEKLLIYVGGPPSPEMLEDSELKMDSPTDRTTWFIIFIIIGFMGLLGVVFFFTWHQQAQITEKVMLNARKTSFPGVGESAEEEVEEVEDIREDPEGPSG